MDIRKTIAAVLTAAMVLSMSACANSENPNDSTENVSGNIIIKTDYKAMWKILPEIEETPIENFVYEYDVEASGMVITGYKVQSPKVRIPDKIEGEPVVGVNLPDSTITEIIMPDTVKRAVLNKTCLQYANYPLSLDTYEDLFGEMSSFYGYSAPGSANEAFNGSTVQAVYIPDGIKSIPDSAFKNCSSLETINLPNSVTEINDYAFEGCKSLMNITLPDNLSYLAGTSFSGGEDYENIVFTHKGKKYTYENSMDLYILINYCDGMQIRNRVLIDTLEDITEAVIPDGVTGIADGAFKNRKNLKSVTIPNSVTEIGNYAFNYCTSLRSVVIPDSVTAIGYGAFDSCTSLTSVTIPNSITEIDSDTFGGSKNVVVTYKGKRYNYEHLSDWLVDAIKFDESGMVIEYGVLKAVSRELTEVVIPNNVTKIQGYSWGINSTIPAFSGCTSLTRVTIPNSVTEIEQDTFKDCTSLTSVTIPDSVTKIGYGAFSGCTSLSSVTIPDSVTKIEQDTFEDCTSIKATYKGKTYNYGQILKLYNVINSGSESGMLIENGVLKSVSKTLSEVVIPEGVTKISGEAFADCTGLTSVTIPSSVNDIDDDIFKDAKYLGNITLCCNEMFVKIIGAASRDSRSFDITLYSVDDDVWISSYNLGLGEHGIPDSWRIISITLPDNVRSFSPGVLRYNARIEIIYKGETYDYDQIPDLDDYIQGGESGLRIENGILTYVSRKLTDVVIPDGVTGISVWAFQGYGYEYENLRSITIPDSVTWIGTPTYNGKVPSRGEKDTNADIFYAYCPNLEGVTYKGKTYDRRSLSELCMAINGYY